MTHPFSRPLPATERSEHDRGAGALASAFAPAQRCGLPLRAAPPAASTPAIRP
jgi:hypothetical protein